jgi:hypothetical protein
MNEQLRRAIDAIQLYAQQLPEDDQNRIAAHLLEDLKMQKQTTLASQSRPLTPREFIEKQYYEGKLANIPTRRGWTQEEKEEYEQIVQGLAGGKPVSEMVIEDRGPY